jgi:hypothetical protein
MRKNSVKVRGISMSLAEVVGQHGEVVLIEPWRTPGLEKLAALGVSVQLVDVSTLAGKTRETGVHVSAVSADGMTREAFVESDRLSKLAAQIMRMGRKLDETPMLPKTFHLRFRVSDSLSFSGSRKGVERELAVHVGDHRPELGRRLIEVRLDDTDRLYELSRWVDGAVEKLKTRAEDDEE